ncbi:MAG: ABC transporter permease [Vicinamibacterales bacterium]
MKSILFALRSLFRSPFVTVVAIVSLGLGIGANAAIFSMFDQMLLRPLPAEDPDRLVNLAAPGPKPGSQSSSNAGRSETVFSYPMFRDLEQAQAVFTGMAAHRSFEANLSYRRQTLNGAGMFVSGSYFQVLGLQPALGRLIGPADDKAPGESPVVVLSHAYWRTRFDASPSVVNDTLIVNGQSMTIIGVAPAGFDGTTLGTKPQVFAPITMRGRLGGPSSPFTDRRNYWVYVFARLKPGVSVEQARTAINLPYRAIINDVEAPLQQGMSDQTLAKFKTKQLTVEPGRRGQSSVHREARAPLVLLLGVTGFVLLIACANIANLLLARGAARATEMAVRLSIGAGRWQLVRQLLVESCLLALFGGTAGLLFSGWTLNGILAMMPADVAGTIHPGIDARILLFAAALTLGTGLLFGLFPAIHSTRPDLVTALKGQSGQPGGSRSAARFRTSLATLQIALSMMLLISSGLFIRSLANVSRVDLGLDPDHVVTFGISPRLNAYTPDRSRALFERLEGELAAVPGVSGVTASVVPLLAGNNWGRGVDVEGFAEGPDTDDNSNYNQLGPAYFRTLGSRLLAGREFTPADAAGAPKVAIVNEAFAKKYNLGRNAVGKRMGFEAPDGKRALDIEIVGLVQNTKYSEVKDPVPSLFFTPYRQDDNLGFITFYVRTALDPAQLLAAIPKVVSAVDPDLPVENLRTLSQQVQENVFVDRLITVLSAGFALLATLLAAIGLYGVLAYTVAQRTREIGVRMALGAGPRRVRSMVLAQVGAMAAVGGVIGLAAALALGRAARSMLFELQGHDPAVIAGAVAALALVALGAGLIPAHRAARVDPIRALRYE